MYDAPNLRPRPVASLLPPEPWEELPCIEGGGAGSRTRILCGYLLCNQHFHLLAGSLPPLLLVRRLAADGTNTSEPFSERGIVSMEPGDWLDSTLHHLITEGERSQPGTMAMIARLGELLYVEVLRRYMCRVPPEPDNWLSAVNDPDVGRVLRLIHAEPGQDWTVESLAREVGISRSLLAQRFTALVGVSPKKYLGEWRVQLAKQMLPQPGVSISQIADRVGYGSEAAFTRAFKRSVGQPPAAWRRTTIRLGTPLSP
jgi:AraC-like DNA-binding protein